MEYLKIIDSEYDEDCNTVYVKAIKIPTLSSMTIDIIVKDESVDKS